MLSRIRSGRRRATGKEGGEPEGLGWRKMTMATTVRTINHNKCNSCGWAARVNGWGVFLFLIRVLLFNIPTTTQEGLSCESGFCCCSSTGHKLRREGNYTCSTQRGRALGCLSLSLSVAVLKSRKLSDGIFIQKRLIKK